MQNYLKYVKISELCGINGYFPGKKEEVWDLRNYIIAESKRINIGWIVSFASFDFVSNCYQNETFL